MKDVRATLSIAFKKLVAVAVDHDLKAENPAREAVDLLIESLESIRKEIDEAILRASGHCVIEKWAIGVEISAGEYEKDFRYGPTEERYLMFDAPKYPDIFAIRDGDVLVRIVISADTLYEVTEAVWLDGKWNETFDQLKEVEA